MILVSREISRCCFFGTGSEESSLGSISRVRFWNSLLKRALEIGEKRCKRVLEGKGGGVILSGSEIVIKEELLDASSA